MKVRWLRAAAALWTTAAGVALAGGSSSWAGQGKQDKPAGKAGSGIDPDAILSKLTPTGASKVTAGQDGLKPGVAASHQMAKTDAERVLKHRDKFEQAGRKLGLPPALLAAIASRESRGGSALDKNGWGDRGNGFGIMQVDKNFHKIEGGKDPASAAHIMQASGILDGYWEQVKKKHPKWPPERQLQGAVVAYNSGVDNVQTIDGMDKGTTGDDYSNDVWARAQYYAKNWGK